jgi:hypothetical protein
MIKLPEGIDYSEYNSTSGMATKIWGPVAWKFLFISILGRYPVKIDKKNKEHLVIQKEFKHLLTSLQHVLPCVFCRNSFKDFLKIIPIKNYLGSRVELMFWLYSMKDLVNKKLINQELKCYINEKRMLKKNANNITEYNNQKQLLKQKTFITKQTPHFKQVLDYFESFRATCSKKSLSCVLPSK